LSEQSNTDVIAEALHAVLGVRWRVRCEHGDGSAPRAQEGRQAPRAAVSAPSGRTPQAPGQAPDVLPSGAGGPAPAGRPPVGGPAPGKGWSRTPGGGAPSADGAGGRPPADRSQAAGGRWQSGAAQASGGRSAGRPSAREDGVPLPPEPPEEDTPPDDEEAMLAELDAGPSEQQHAPARSDPEEAAIALLTSQLGARAIDRR
jgi:DNA polymerase-3 subunit gamma/tau